MTSPLKTSTTAAFLPPLSPRLSHSLRMDECTPARLAVISYVLGLGLGNGLFSWFFGFNRISIALGWMSLSCFLHFLLSAKGTRTANHSLWRMHFVRWEGFDSWLVFGPLGYPTCTLLAVSFIESWIKETAQSDWLDTLGMDLRIFRPMNDS